MIQAFVETDCADETGIDDLRSIIARETNALEHLRDPFPASWFGVKSLLSAMAGDYLTFEQYRDICRQHYEFDPAGQEALAGFLHNLGIVLNYRDDPRLQDTHVLNPQWVTTGVYGIIRSDLLEAQRGELQIADLRDILDLEKYPPERHHFLIDLMRKFELCFPFVDDPTRFLVAEQLDKQEPEDVEEFEVDECLNFEYRYPVLPEGLLPRFIVRTNALSQNQPRWRSGVILGFEGNRALVTADHQEHRVRISIAGDFPDRRRRFLAVVRSHFETIHASFAFTPGEFVPLPDHPDVLVPYKDLLAFESASRKSYELAVNGKVISVDVQAALDGVDIIRERKETVAVGSDQRPLRLFYSYSHKDEGLRLELETHLTLLRRVGLLEGWNDRRITAGTEWKGAIDEHMRRADLILLLVSADFLASDYCYDVEATLALERHERREARVVPVIVRDVNWKLAPFSKLQALPIDGKAVMTWADRDSAWKNVEEGLGSLLNEMRSKARR